MPQNRIVDIKQAEASPNEPVTLAEVKAQLIITFTDDDALLTRLITQARKAIENYCAVSLVVKTITLTADLYSDYELPYGPVTGIQGVSTPTGTQGSGPVAYETAATGWQQEGEEFVSFVPGNRGGWDWGPPPPRNYPAGPNRYRIVYTTGYNPVPDDLKLAVLQQVAFLYEHRGNDPDKVMCEQAQALAFSYKRLIWF